MSEEEDKSWKTQIYTSSSDDAMKTTSYGAQTDSCADRTTTHNLGAGDTVQLTENEYQIERIISGEKKSGEAVIYLIRDHTGNDYALKLYYPFRDPRDEPNSEALKRIKAINNPDILKLHHFGTGAEKYQGQFCYEISDFARGGDLLNVACLKDKYTPEFLERKVIPEIFKGIQVLHQHRIYHCDLKPQNVFYRDEKQTDLVIGDYGSAKSFEQSSEKELSYMSVVKGTDFYLAPEQAIGIISEKNDYYSFGMILLHLLYPEKVDQQTLRKIYERRAAEKPIIDYDSKYKRLNDLIAGLTLQDIQQRWGQKEVSQWLAGKSVTVNYKKAAAPSVMPIKLKATTIQTEEDLLDYVQKGDEWYRLLIEDQQGYHLLLTWISQMRDIESKQSFDNLIRIARKYGKDCAREAVIRFFQPNRPIKLISEYDLFNTDDIEKITSDFLIEFDDQWKITITKDDRAILFSYFMALQQYADSAVGDQKKSVMALMERFRQCLVLGTTRRTDDNKPIPLSLKTDSNNESFSIPNSWELLTSEITDDAIVRIFYEFNPSRHFRDIAGKSFSTLEEVALCFAGNPALWDNRFLSAERCVYLEKKELTQLRDVDRKTFMFSVFKKHILFDLEILGMEFQGGRVDYQLKCSLTDFLKQQGVRENLVMEITTESTYIVNFIGTPVEKTVSTMLSMVEQELELPPDKWTQHTQKALHQCIEKEKAERLKIIKTASHRKITSAIKSFALLLPMVLLYFIVIAFIEKNISLINFLSSITPFDIAFDSPFLSEAPSLGLFFIMICAMIPSLFLIFRGTDPDLRYIHQNMIIYISLVWLIIMPCIMIHFPLPITSIHIIGVTVWAYFTLANRISLKHFAISLIPALLLIFLGEVMFKDIPLSAKISDPIHVQVELRNESLRPQSQRQDNSLYVRSGPSAHHAVTAVVRYRDTLNVIAEDTGWYLIRTKNTEGYLPVKDVGILGYLKNKTSYPSQEIRYPLNFSISPKSITTEEERFIRAGPSEDYAVIALLKENKYAMVIAKENEWYLARLGQIEGYIKTSEVQETIMKKGRLINKNPILRKEPNYKSKSMSNRWNDPIDIYAEYDGWYLIRSFYGDFGYVSKRDVRIIQ